MPPVSGFQRKGPVLLPWLSSPLSHLQLLLVLALLLGGGGVAYGLRNFVIQLAALAILAFHRRLVWQFFTSRQVALIALVLASVALPLLQLVPLPPAVWQGLPGRDAVSEAFAIAGIGADSWFPLSLDRGRTLVAFCGTLAPATIVIVGSGLGPQQKARLAWALVGCAAVALLIGVAQLSSANTGGLFYPITPKPDVLYATFANRNSTALLFVMAIVLLASVPLVRGRAGLLVVTGGIAVLALGAVLTQSRSGMALTGAALGFVLLRTALGYWQLRQGRYGVSRSAALAAGLVGLAVAAALAISAFGGGRAASSLERLTDGQTDRPQIWEDTVYAIGVYWPLGSGMGTFDETFQMHESLEFLSPRKAGRAHNDWLEIGLEAGLAAYVLVLGWLVWIAQAAMRGEPVLRWTRLGAAFALATVAAQSALDYPLRNQTLLCAAAVCIVLLARTRRQPL